MFENLIGNNEVKKFLSDSLINQKTSHSYIFKGEEGIGKKLFAREFAKGLLCLNNEVGNDKCDSCIKYNAGSNPDYNEIEPDGKRIKIDQIRKLQEKIQERPIISNKKVYIIDNADTMTEESQNCLLKTLEEPPKYATIILITTDENKLLPTIKSRCIMIKFDTIPNEKLRKYLPNYTDNQIKLLGGSFKNLENIEEIEENYRKLQEIVDVMRNGNKIDLIEKSELLYNQKDNIMVLLDYLNIILLEQNILEPIFLVESTKRKILYNNNYEMCIDGLLIESWNVLHK